MLLVTRGRVILGRGIVVIAATDEQNTCGYLRVFADFMETPTETPTEIPNRYSRTARLAIQVKDKGKVQTLLWRVSLSSSIEQHLYFDLSNLLVLPWSLLHLFYPLLPALPYLRSLLLPSKQPWLLHSGL